MASSPASDRQPKRISPALHPPKQERSRQTLERIARAALELMAEVGPEGASVAEIVKRAGASVGSFYARFDGKDDLVLYLHQRVWAEARERWDEALEREDWGALPMASVVEGVVGLLFRTLEADYRQRGVLGRLPELPGGGREAPEAFHRHVLSGVSPLLLERRGEMTHADPEQGVELGYRLVVGGIREILERGGTGDSRRKRLVRELARAWTAYLTFGAEGSTPPPDGEVDFFDPWG